MKLAFRYKPGKESEEIEKKKDPLIFYQFDETNSFLFRRGLRNLQIYKIRAPSLSIKRKSGAVNYDTKIAHLCSEPVTFQLFY